MQSCRIYNVLVLAVLLCAPYVHNAVGGWSDSYDRLETKQVRLYGMKVVESVEIKSPSAAENITIGPYWFGELSATTMNYNRTYYTNLCLLTNSLSYYGETTNTYNVGGVTATVGRVISGSVWSGLLTGVEMLEHDIAYAIMEREIASVYSVGSWYVFSHTPSRRNIKNLKQAAKALVGRFYNTNVVLGAYEKYTTYTVSNLLTSCDLPTNYFEYTPDKLEYGGPEYGHVMTCGTYIVGGTANHVVTNYMPLYTGGYACVWGTNGQYVSVVVTNMQVMEGFTTRHYSMTNMITLLNKLTIVKWEDYSTIKRDTETEDHQYWEHWNIRRDHNDIERCSGHTSCAPDSWGGWSEWTGTHATNTCSITNSSSTTTNSLSGQYVYRTGRKVAYRYEVSDEIRSSDTPTPGLYWSETYIKDLKTNSVYTVYYSYEATAKQRMDWDKISHLGISNCSVIAGILYNYPTNEVSFVRDHSYVLAEVEFQLERCDDVLGTMIIGGGATTGGPVFYNNDAGWVGSVSTTHYQYVNGGIASIYHDDDVVTNHYGDVSTNNYAAIAKVIENFPYPTTSMPPKSYGDSMEDQLSGGAYGSCDWEYYFVCERDGCAAFSAFLSYVDEIHEKDEMMTPWAISGSHDVLLNFAVTNGFKYY